MCWTKVDGVRLLLRTAAEACLPALRLQIEASDLLPQQALGALSFCCEVLNRLLVNLEDPTAYAKFSKLKVAALRKRLPKRPDLTEAVLVATGFKEAGEYLEWGPQSVEVLARAVAVLALVSRLQETAQTSEGLRCLVQRLSSDITPSEVLSLNYGCKLLEPVRETASVGSKSGYINPLGVGTTNTAGGIEGALVTRQWLANRTPGFAAALEEFPSLSSSGPREKALVRSVSRALNDFRSQANLPRFNMPQKLVEVAQLAAVAQLLSLRRPDLLEAMELPKEVQVCEPDMEPELDGAEKEGKDIFHATNPPREDSGIVGRQVAKILLESVPAFRLGMTAEFLSEVLRLAEAPAFFTMSLKEKPFEVSLQSLTERICADWQGSAMMVSSIGIGCAVDIDNDDKAVVFAVLA